jgi:hypothetical protein
MKIVRKADAHQACPHHKRARSAKVQQMWNLGSQSAPAVRTNWFVVPFLMHVSGHQQAAAARQRLPLLQFNLRNHFEFGI